MSRTSILYRLIRTIDSTAVFISLLSPAHATARLPWPALVGHRQPHRADVPQSEDPFGAGAPATTFRPGVGPQAGHLPRLLSLCKTYS